MTRQTIHVVDFEDKKTTNGDRYTRFKTNTGYMSCFNKKESEKLKKYEGKDVSIEIRQAGKFSNIEKVYGEDTATEDEQEVKVEAPRVPEKPNTERIDRAKALELALKTEFENNSELFTRAEQYFNYITKGI